jgi:hypothetical protein
MNFAASNANSKGRKHGGPRNMAWIHAGLRKISEELSNEQVLRERNKGFLPETFNRASFNTSAEDISSKKLFINSQHCHLLPQSDYIWDEAGERTCSFVLRYEHLHAEFESLAKLFGVSAFVNLTSSSADGGGSGCGGGGGPPSGALVSVLDDMPSSVAHRDPHAFTVEHMEPDVKEAFLRIYAADFCLLGYDKSTSAPAPPPLLENAIQAGGPNFARCACQRDPRVCSKPIPRERL